MDVNDVQNPSEEKFLFVCTVRQVDKESFCGISLKIAVRIISVVALISSGFQIFDAIHVSKIFNMIWAICLSVFFLIISFYTLMSTINNKYSYCQMGYYVFAILFLLKTLYYLVNTILFIIGFFNPFGSGFFEIKGLAYTIGEGVILVFYCYFVWVIYCFMIELKHHNSSD